MLFSMVACSGKAPVDDASLKYHRYAKMTPEEIVNELTLEQKAAQMVQPAVYMTDTEDMRINDYGSILSTAGCIDAHEWRKLVDSFQQSAIESESGIPYIYGQDDVHGVNYCLDAVYFPHNIGVGAANDEELAYQAGLITADEAKLCHMMWNFAPVVAQSVDPRWGRTYESYGSDLETITRLSTAYTKGLIDGGIVACAKHFFADGNISYGTGEQSPLDRGDSKLTEDQINELLKVYQAQIDAGVQTIMISHSALNGVKMHENGEYIMKLKNEMGFEGFIVSDWESVGNIPGDSYKSKVVRCVNAGIDMLMEPERFDETRRIIIEAVGNGEIPESRINDAVRRIIKVKKDIGLFDDPKLLSLQTKQSVTGTPEYRKVAERLVEESLVLIKNDKNLLPLKKGTKVYITGPAADNGQAQCGGWTIEWNNAPEKEVEGVTTILDAFSFYSRYYGIDIITDPALASSADVVVLCVGEDAYAEWNGDTDDLALCGHLGLPENRAAIDEVKALGKPTVTCIVAGRNVILDKSDLDSWDSVVMCYLPGSEGKGVSDVLCGYADFVGRLPSPWYGSIDQIGTDMCFLEKGYGLTYGDGFKPRLDNTARDPFAYRFRKYRGAGPEDEESNTSADDVLKGTNYTQGTFDDGVYVNSYAGIKLDVPSEFVQARERDQVLAMKNLITQCDSEEEIVRESSKKLDCSFMSTRESIDIKFVNTKRAMPDDPNYLTNEYLDDFKDFLQRLSDRCGVPQEYDERVKVVLGGKEYVREIVRAPGFNQYFYFYVRKLDDDLMLVIEVVGIADKDPEYYEKMFG